MTSYARGESSEDVRVLQEALNEAGATPPLEVTGRFCPATETALIAYQIWHGLRADGVAGPKTRLALGLGDPPEWPQLEGPPERAAAGGGTDATTDGSGAPVGREPDPQAGEAGRRRAQLERELALLATALHRRRRDCEGVRHCDPAEARESARDAEALLAVYRKKSAEARRVGAATRPARRDPGRGA